MNIYALPKQLNVVPATPRIIALGVFDGVHIGHRAVLTRALLNHELTPAVFTFCGMESVKKGSALQTNEERREQLEILGFSDVFEADFAKIKDFSPQQFVTLLSEKLCAKAIVCGYNFRFGKGGTGDTAQLRTLCEQAGITLYILPAVEVDGVAVSSTRIKQALAAGDVRTVTRLLSRPFTFHTKVESGQQLGRTFGAPTINQPLIDGIAVPRFGVYASIAIIDGKAIPAITDIGVRPTVGSPAPLAETYILGFDGNLYGETVPVQLVKFLRPEQKFPTVEALKAQIQKDIADATSVFTPKGGSPLAILFDFDNTLQDRDIASQKYLREWLKKHFPEMSDADLDKHSDTLMRSGEHGFVPYRIILETAQRLFPDHPFDLQEGMDFLTVAYPANTTLFPDAKKTLQNLRDKGYLLGMVSNGNSRIQNSKVDISGIRPYFDYILITGDEGLQKPDVEPFRRAALRLGVHPADCVYVGDNPINDIKGAKDAGMQTVFRDFGITQFSHYDYEKITADKVEIEEISVTDIIDNDQTKRISALCELTEMF